ncbi:hypothetical protein ABTZ78_17270 [Streptomyces bauhiniae]|uniref:hypothetical protein n=1 Tax=Streptomyces bauhiniae TaxID=2340725 RepID=UPI003334396B
MSEPRDTTPRTPDVPEALPSSSSGRRRYSQRYEALVRGLGLRLLNTMLWELTPAVIAAAFQEHAARLRGLADADCGDEGRGLARGLLHAVREAEETAAGLRALDGDDVKVPPLRVSLTDYVNRLLGAEEAGEKDTLIAHPARQDGSTPSADDIRQHLLALGVPTPDGSLTVHRVYGVLDTWAIVHRDSSNCWDRTEGRWVPFTPGTPARSPGALYHPLAEAWTAAHRLAGAAWAAGHRRPSDSDDG